MKYVKISGNGFLGKPNSRHAVHITSDEQKTLCGRSCDRFFIIDLYPKDAPAELCKVCLKKSLLE